MKAYIYSHIFTSGNINRYTWPVIKLHKKDNEIYELRKI